MIDRRNHERSWSNIRVQEEEEATQRDGTYGENKRDHQGSKGNDRTTEDPEDRYLVPMLSDPEDGSYPLPPTPEIMHEKGKETRS